MITDYGFHLYKARLFDPIVLKGADPDDPDFEGHEDLHEIRIIDNDYNTYEEVMQITMFALGVDEDAAFAIAWEVDHRGSCVVAQAPRDEAEAIAKIIRTIGIEVQVNPVNHAVH